MSKLWVFTDCASPTSSCSLRYFSVITSKGDLLVGFLLSFCKPLHSLGKCAFLPWGGKEGTCFRLVPLAPHGVANESPGNALLAWHSCPSAPIETCSYHTPWFLLVQTCILFLVIKQTFNRLKILLLACAYIRCISALQLFSCLCGFRIGTYRAELTALP